MARLGLVRCTLTPNQNGCFGRGFKDTPDPFYHLKLKK